MAYLNDLYIMDPNKNRLHKLIGSNLDTTDYASVYTGNTPNGIAVSTDMVSVWISNRNDGTVSLFKNGKEIRTVAVGKYPMGIAINDSGAVYVANYGSNTVSKIVNGVKVMDLPTGRGPRGVCVSKTGDVYVTNFIDNTVTRFINDVKVDTIKVGVSPYGITACHNGKVYVACASSGTLDTIDKGYRESSVNVGKIPYGVCIDKNGAAWVSNYSSNTVSKVVGLMVQATVNVGNGPYSISATQDGNVMVMNYLANSVSVINCAKAEVVSTIPLPNITNPIAFGDATGFGMYHVGNGVTGGGSGSGSLNIGFSDLDTELKKAIELAASVTFPIDSKNIAYPSSEYPTIEAAVDHAINDPISISRIDGLDATLKNLSHRQMIFVMRPFEVETAPVELLIPMNCRIVSGTAIIDTPVGISTSVAVEKFNGTDWDTIVTFNIANGDLSTSVSSLNIAVLKDTRVRCKVISADSSLDIPSCSVQIDLEI